MPAAQACSVTSLQGFGQGHPAPSGFRVTAADQTTGNSSTAPLDHPIERGRFSMPDTTTAANTDWTADIDGRSNSSSKYLALVDAVDQTIRGCAHALVGGKSRAVAAMIMAQLAHQHGLAPTIRNTEPANVELGDTARDLLKGLTVAQLRTELADLPDDMPVIVYGEHGQNGESPASGVAVGWYYPESGWGGSFHDGTDPDRVPDPETEARAVFIEPIN